MNGTRIISEAIYAPDREAALSPESIQYLTEQLRHRGITPPLLLRIVVFFADEVAGREVVEVAEGTTWSRAVRI